MLLQIDGLSKLYDRDKGVRDFNLEVKAGEFITILGPSGCGKTTMLNLIGGFLRPDKGRILMEGEDITGMPPEARHIATVFQNYALFPHLNIIENIAFGIRFQRKVKKNQALMEAREYLCIVGLEGYEKSRVNEISGGQQQRVALARAMATNPKLLLLDEPLSNLDANLRLRLRDELKSLQKRLGITMIFVTHDQSEALSLSDRIVLMDKGLIVQTGSPRELYFQPASIFAATFIGKSNVISEEDGSMGVVRPESIKIYGHKDGKYTIEAISFLGQFTELRISDGQQSLEVLAPGQAVAEFRMGDRVRIEISPSSITPLSGTSPEAQKKR